MRGFDVSESKGQISIFLCIIIIPVLLIGFILVDGARINTARTRAEQAVKNAAFSALACYNGALKKDYGLFALSNNDEGLLTELVGEYLEKNLDITHQNEQDLSFYEYSIRNITVTPVFNLSENHVTKSQILEYMKYRGPEKIVEGFFDKLASIKDCARMSEVYNKKFDIDRLAGFLDEKQENLKKYIDGGINGIKESINGFNAGGVRDIAIKGLGDLVEGSNTCSLDIQSLDAEILETNSEIAIINDSIQSYREEIIQTEKRIKELEKERDKNSNTDNESESQADDIIDEKSDIKYDVNSIEIKELEEIINGIEDKLLTSNEKLSNARSSLNDAIYQRDCLLDKLKQTKRNILNQWDYIYNDLTCKYIQPNQKALQEGQTLFSEGQTLLGKISSLTAFVDSCKFTNNTFSDTVKLDLSDIGKLIPLTDESGILDSIGNNLKFIQNQKNRLDNLRELLQGDISALTGQYVEKFLSDSSKSYNAQIVYDYQKAERQPGEDIRKKNTAGILDGLKGLLDGMNDAVKAGIKKEELPSRSKIISNVETVSEKEVYDNKEEGLSWEGSEKINEDIDFGNKSLFTSQAFSFLSSMGNFIGDNLEAMRDELYVNEYIMQNFKSAVQKKDSYLKDRNSFFDNEVEYILNGSMSDSINRAAAIGEILLVRFGMNTIHVYTDGSKKAMAQSMAAVAAGWWTGGLGIPIISNLIMGCWGMGESILDINDLLQGKEVPFYKTASEWKTDIDLITREKEKTAVLNITFNYNDYMRLFLLLKGSNKKINAVEDLIQMNIMQERPDFRINSANTCIKVQAEVSVNYLFLYGVFVNNQNKDTEGKHVFRITWFESY